METQLSRDEFIQISQKLQQYYSVFYALWENGKIVFDNNIKTASVAEDYDGDGISFLFNKQFWDSLDEYNRLFVICHEMLHIVLFHCRRMRELNHEIANIAVDIVTNHMLVSIYGFDREKIQNWEQYCWVDTVFKDNPPSPNYNFEYYYLILSNQDISELSSVSGVDEHNYSFDVPRYMREHINEFSDDIISQIQDIADNEPYNNTGCVNKGNTPEGIWKDIVIKNKKKKQKWETIINKFAAKIYMNSDLYETQWAYVNRRFTNIPADIILPYDYYYDGKDRRIDLWFFIDASGSCSIHNDRFFNVVRSVPYEKFKTRLFSFDTEVYELDITKPRIRGGGGTSFSCIEKYIQKEIEFKKVKYPSAVFLITDGYGDMLNAQYPYRWCILLTPNGDTKCFSKKSHIYKLSDFE